MLPHRVQYDESESDIQNYNLFYKNAKNTKILSKSRKVNRLFTPPNRHTHRLFRTPIGCIIPCIIPVRIFYNKYVIFYFYNLYILYKYIFIYFYILIYICLKKKERIIIYSICIYIYIYVRAPSKGRGAYPPP